jgi:hypothetical protein
MPSVFARAFSGSVLTAVGVWNFVDDDAHVVHPFDHGGSPSSSRGPSWPLVSLGRSQRHILDTRKRAEF